MTYLLTFDFFFTFVKMENIIKSYNPIVKF